MPQHRPSTPRNVAPRRSAAQLPALIGALFRGLVPGAEREEMLADLAAEHDDRARTDGAVRARLWLWRQLVASLPALLRRGWWRGWTGFEPAASRMRPGGLMFESWIMDLRYSARRLATRPAYTLLAVLTLGLGAGGTAAIYSVVHALLLAPLPIADEDRVGVFWNPYDWTEQEFLFLRGAAPGIARLAAYRPDDATLDRPGAPLRLVRAISSSADLFDVLGAAPLHGRTFAAGDDAQGAEPVVVLAHGLWQDLGADASIVGQPLMLGGVARRVVGVMPPGFWFPDPSVRAWMVVPLSPQRRAGLYTLVARVAADRTVDTMQGPLDAIARSLGERFTYPAQWDKTRAPSMATLRTFLVGDARAGVLATFIGMTLILGIACVNVAAMMLGQLGRRTTELAVRRALGAGRRRLAQQLVLEAVLIGAMAGPAGALLAAAAFAALVGALPLDALAESIALDWTVFWAASVVALVAAAAIAVVPGFAIWRDRVRSHVPTTRTDGAGGRGSRLEGGLVVVQIALAVLLAAGAGLVMRSVGNLRAIDPGFDVRGVAVADTTMATRQSHDQRRRLVTDMVSSLQALPGARAVAATQKLPLRGSGDNWGLGIAGKPDLAQSTTALRFVTADYFEALGVAVRRGRVFTADDRATTERVVVINEALAARYFPGEDPLGQVVHSGFGASGERIVGVVANMAEADLTDAAVPARYMLLAQSPLVPAEMSFVLSAEAPERIAALLDSARGLVQAPGSGMALQRTTTMASVFDLAVGTPGRVGVLLGLLAGLALVLGAVGVFGVMSHFVGRRRREYGIQIALGLSPGRVVSQVVGHGVLLCGVGCALGIGGTLLLTGPLTSWLYGVGRADPIALGGAVLALVVVGALAAFVPARRASRTDPASVLRQAL